MMDVAYEILTSVHLESIDSDLYKGFLNGRHVIVEHMVHHRNLAISICARNPPPEAKAELIRSVILSAQVSEQHILFDHGSATVLLPVRDGLGEQTKKVIEILSAWADTYDMPDGCFLCGETNASVKYAACGEIRTFLCKSCTDNLLQSSAQNLARHSVSKDDMKIDENGSVSRARFRGVMAGLITGILCSVIWLWLVPNAIIVLGFVLGTAIAAALVYLVSESYRGAAKRQDLFGFIASLIISFILLSACVLIVYSPYAMEYQSTQAEVLQSNEINPIWLSLLSLSESKYRTALFTIAFPPALGLVIGSIYLYQSGKYN